MAAYTRSQQPAHKDEPPLAKRHEHLLLLLLTLLLRLYRHPLHAQQSPLLVPTAKLDNPAWGGRSALCIPVDEDVALGSGGRR